MLKLQLLKDVNKIRTVSDGCYAILTAVVQASRYFFIENDLLIRLSGVVLCAALIF